MAEWSINVERRGEVTSIVFHNPPVNALSIGNGLADALGDAICRALADPLTKAVVIGSQGRFFCAGADLTDLDEEENKLRSFRWLTSEVIEDAEKPVVAAIQGNALGGGLEVALACHYRVCAPDAQFALPEIKLGLLPGAGGTQRLPRLVGPAFALGMMLDGNPVSAATALEKGLVDVIAEEDLAKASVAFAQTCIARGPRPTRNLPVAPDPPGRQTAQSRPRLTPAAACIAQCVEAALTCSFAEGMAIEKKLFEQLRTSEESKGLRHVFFGQRAVGRVPGLAEGTAVHPIRTAAVVGAGTMGRGIATALINAGLKVDLIDMDPAAAARAVATIKDTLERDVGKGRLSPQAAAERFALLAPGSTIACASQADLVIEAVFEDLAVKRRVFEDLDKTAKPSAILATNTSALDVNAIASATARPERIVGLHFFSPANIMKLVEVVKADKTSDETLATAMQFVKAIGKVGVVAGVCDGFIGNRMFEEYLRQAYFLLEEGALPQQVDAALEDFGMAMGPFKVMDLAGLDIGWSIRKRRAAERPDQPYSKIPDMICELGRFGQKTGAGYYLYPDGRTPQVDPFVDKLVGDVANGSGTPRRAIGPEEIVDRCILALVNEGAKILAEGIALRPVDIDMVYVFGYGYPAYRGGPMFYADRRGLANVLKKIAAFRNQTHGWAWSPAPLLTELAQRGGTFGLFGNTNG